jgi:hypothetical protein
MAGRMHGGPATHQGQQPIIERIGVVPPDRDSSEPARCEREQPGDQVAKERVCVAYWSYLLRNERMRTRVLCMANPTGAGAAATGQRPRPAL